MFMRGFLVLLSAGFLGFWASRGPAADDTAAADEKILKGAEIGTTDEAVLEYLRRRTLTDIDREGIRALIRQLGDDSFFVREKASTKLLSLGQLAREALEEAKKSQDIEVVRRAEECLRLMKQGAGTSVPKAAVRWLARRKPAAAAEVLLAYLPFADDESVAEEVRAALVAVAVRDGKPEPAVVTALGDKSAQRRAAAGEALCRAGGPEGRAAARRLLQDTDPTVRLRVGLALVAAKEREAVPVLIALLGQLPREQSWRAEEVLLELAGEKAPSVALGTDEASREKCRQAWAAWWQDQGPQVDLAKLGQAPKLLGYTLLVLLDAGRVLELDQNDKERWKVEGLDFPLDVQLLPGGRILVAEHGANRVTERDTKGEVKWQKQVVGPLAAQRLRNGNTFIATNSQLLEVTRDGKEVFSFVPNGGEAVMKAQKLRNGDIGVILSGAGSRFVRLDSQGRELKSFPVSVNTSGGRIDVLSNGHVLVPELRTNRLVEYDAEGKSVKEFPVDQPIAAVRLPNGHTLVTSMTQLRAIELDAAGKEVWQYKSDTRVTRAFRR